jgi:hypothetical protein
MWYSRCSDINYYSAGKTEEIKPFGDSEKVSGLEKRIQAQISARQKALLRDFVVAEIRACPRFSEPAC